MAHVIQGNVFIKADPNETEVVIPEGITEISSGAFYVCKARKIVVPESVTSLNEKSFDASGMTSITLNANISIIPRRCFNFCNRLKEIALPDSVETIEEDAFRLCSSLERIKLSKNLKKIGVGAFANCEKLKEIILPDSVEFIGQNAFYQCEELERIEIPDSVQEIGSAVFTDCYKLKYVSIPEGCKLGLITFPKHTEVVMRTHGKDEVKIINKAVPLSITKEGTTLIKGNPEEKHAIIPNDITIIGKEAFKRMKCLEDVLIPEYVTELGNECFLGAKNLKKAVIRGKIKSIPELAFSGCSNLEEVILPDSIESLEYSAFQECIMLKSIELPSGLKRIKKYAFYSCKALKEIVIPDTVEKIDEVAFFGCDKLEKVVVPDSVKQIGADAFNCCPALKEMSIPKGCYMVKRAQYKDLKVTIRPVEKTAEDNDKPPAKKPTTKKKTKATGKIYRYDEDISFDLPKGFDFTDGKDTNGNRSVMIGINPKIKNGETDHDKLIAVTTVNAESPDTDVLDQIEKVNVAAKVKKRYDTQPEALLICSETESAILGVSIIIRIFALNIRISSQKALSLRLVGGGAGEGVEEVDQELAMLMSVWPTVMISGEKVTTKAGNSDDENEISGKIRKQNETKINNSWDSGNHVLKIGNRWQMKLPSGLRVLEEPSDDEDMTHLRFFYNASTFGTTILGTTVSAQKNANKRMNGTFASIKAGGTNIADITLRDDEEMTVRFSAYLNAEEPMLVEIRIAEKKPVFIETLLCFLLIINCDDIVEATKNVCSGEDSSLSHPYGIEWMTQWRAAMKIALSIEPVEGRKPSDDPEMEVETFPGITCCLPSSYRQIKFDDNKPDLWYPAKGKPSLQDLKNTKQECYIKIEKVFLDGQDAQIEAALLKTFAISNMWKLMTGFASVIHEHIYEQGYVAAFLAPAQENWNVTVCATNSSGFVLIRILTDTETVAGKLTDIAVKICDSVRFARSEQETCDRAYPSTPDTLHEHYDLIRSGRYTTHRSADFIGQPIRMLLEKQENEKHKVYGLMNIPEDKYSLDKDAISLAKVFRLDETLFDDYRDTEALIRRGMLLDARAIHTLRSLAWEVQSLSERTGKKPGELTIDELKEIGDYIRHNDNLIYDALSYCAGLCYQYDWHVFYVPDAYVNSDDESDNDLRYLTGKENRGGNTISFFMPGIGGNRIGEMNRINNLISRNEETLVSLQALREELEELLPVMQNIHDGLLKNRDRTKQLEGPLADALTAWCALAIAAKEPFYSEEAADTPEADAALDRPLERPKDELDDKPMRTGKTNTKTTEKASANAKKTTITKRGSASKTSKTESFYNNRITFELPEGFDLEKEDDRRRIYYLNERIISDDDAIYDYLFTLTVSNMGFLKPSTSAIDAILNKYPRFRGKIKISEKPYAILTTEDYPDVPRDVFGQVYMLELSDTEVLFIRLKSEWRKDDREYLLDQYNHFIDAVNTMTVDGKPIPALNMSAEEMYDLVFKLRGKEESNPKTTISSTLVTKNKNTAKKTESNKLDENDEKLAEKKKEEEVRRKAADLCDQLGLDLMGDLRIAECVNKNIDEVDIPYGVLSIGMEAFIDCDKLRKVILPESMTKIRSSAFENCTSLEEIIIPDSVTEIESNAFENCESLKKIKIPSGIKTISFGLCQGCTSLKEVIIPEGITCIEGQAFNDCRSLRNVRLPDTIESIGEHAFYKCDNLETISIPDKQIEIGNEYTFPKQAEILRRSVGTGRTTATNTKKSETKVAQGTKPVKGWEHIESYDGMFGFAMPTGYSLDWDIGDDGKPRCFVVYGPYYNNNGERDYRFKAQLSTDTPEDLRYGEGALQALRRINQDAAFARLSTNPKADLMVKTLSMNMLGRTVQLYVIWLIVEKNSREYFLVNFVGTWDNDRSKHVENYRHMINVVNSLRINREPLPTLTDSPETLMRKMPPVFDSNTQTIRGNVELNISVNGQTVSQRTLYGDNQGNVHSKKRYTADMMPPGTEDAQAMADELNAMEPEKAEQMLNLLIGMNKLNQSLGDLNDALDSVADDNPAQQGTGQYSRDEQDNQKQQARKRIQNQITALEKERDEAKGLFAGMKKKKIQKQIDDLKAELRRI